ncbi:MAG: zinc-ribbon domain containing protein [Dehalococcoidia bacterium]|nr:zinc-ribbon domain containing protein [Dehalococcoidia bacterium]
MMQDKTLTCRDCAREFAFTASEQEFFAQKGFTNEPGRCPECRAARKDGRSSGMSGGFNGRREREMFPAVCARCGKATQVPFEPRNDRPVYCSDCYTAQRPAGGGRSSGGGGGSRGGGGGRW